MIKVKNNLLIHIIIFAIALCASCTGKQQKLGAADYISYMENADNGFLKKVTTSDIIYHIQAKTPEYVSLKESNPESSSPESKTIQNRVKQLDSSIWFSIKVMNAKANVNPLKYNARSLQEYNERLNYFLYQAGGNFSLKYDQKEATQIAYYFENSYGVTPYETIVLGFKLSDNLYNKDIELEYMDALFNSGIIKMSVTASDLKNKPILIL